MPQLSKPTAQVETQRPAAQAAFAPHTVLQPPQWKRSFCRSTHPVPQAVRGAVHAATHDEFWQKPPLHEAPQVSQLLPSELVSTHWPLQIVSGAPQLHAPATQSWSELQAVPHAPQLRRSAVTSMQRPLQNDWPLGHDCEQTPA